MRNLGTSTSPHLTSPHLHLHLTSRTPCPRFTAPQASACRRPPQMRPAAWPRCSPAAQRRLPTCSPSGKRGLGGEGGGSEACRGPPGDAACPAALHVALPADGQLCVLRCTAALPPHVRART